MKLAEFLRRMIHTSGSTQSDVCRNVKISQSTLSHVLRGRSDPQLGSFIALGGPLGYQVVVETKDSVQRLGMKGDQVEFVEDMMRSRQSPLERLASYYTPRMSPKDMEELCMQLEALVEARLRVQKKKAAKAG
jgi:transcriptional regulator with XRE-family HTH domain